MTGSYDILIVGIGGQGTILASNILGEACLIEGRHVKGAETHGMAQRGGSVESHIRIDGEFGPLIAPGHADLLISFDLLEALRYSHFLKKDGQDRREQSPRAPDIGLYPETRCPLGRGDHRRAEKIRALPARRGQDRNRCGQSALAERGDARAASAWMPLKPATLLESVRRLVPKKTIEINTKAFEMGRDAFGKH